MRKVTIAQFGRRLDGTYGICGEITMTATEEEILAHLDALSEQGFVGVVKYHD